MGRIHGKRGRVYMGIASGGTAEPLPFIASWEVNQPTDKAPVTAMGDRNKTYVNGMPDTQGSFRGFMDDSTAQVYTAAIDALPRKLYIYPDILSNTKYWYGMAIVDASTAGGVDGPVTLNSSWAAADDFQRSF